MSTNKNTDTDLYRNNAVTNTKILIRAGTCSIKGWIVNNPNAAESFLQIHDAATTGDVTLGTTVPVLPIKVGANGSVVITEHDYQIPFSLGMVIAATTTEGGSSAPVTPVSVLILYK